MCDPPLLGGGAVEVERVDGRAYLTLGSQHNTYGGCHHVIEYFEGPVTALEHVAFRAANPEALQQLRNRLENAGVPATTRPEPGIADAIRFEGPCGHGFELFYGCDYSQKAYTASGVRLRRIQHVNLNASRSGECRSCGLQGWYRAVPDCARIRDFTD
jgi:hypothetical protein